MEPTGLEEMELPQELEALSNVIESKPETLAIGDSEIRLAALCATKFIYDLALKSEAQSRKNIAELLSSISPTLAPQTRSQTHRSSKRKRSSSPVRESPVFKETPVIELYSANMNEDQIWEQLELRTKNVCEVLEFILDGPGNEDGSDDGEDGHTMKKPRSIDGIVGLNEDAMDEDEDEDEDESDEDEDGDDDEDEDDEDDEDDIEDAESVESGEHVTELRDPSESEDDDIDLDKPSKLPGARRPSRRKPKAGGHPELDDGFFDLAAFNAETEAAEAQSVSGGRLGEDEDDDEAEEDTVDYFALVDDDADALDGNAAEDEQRELFYQDFFEPPPRASGSNPRPSKSQEPASGKVRFHEEVRVKKIKAKGKGLPISTMYREDDEDEDEDEYGEEVGEDGELDEDLAWEEDDGQEAEGSDLDDEMAGSHTEDTEDSSNGDNFQTEAAEHLKDDLFAEDEDVETEMTTHQKRMAQLQEEIAALEAENVTKKNWTLMGEATSRSRPQNSLLEEDLEFERVMKTIPVITEETVQGLEDRIKARILEGQFDDVTRKRPVDDKPFLPSRLFEHQDTKSKQSLAEIYEDEYTAAQTGEVTGEDRDGKLKKEHEELTKIWENVSLKLDALCNAHFTPKAPKAAISTISNVAAATLESALPTTRSTSTMLAPEEIFAPSPNDLHARSELTPTQKRAARNKHKKLRKKTHDVLGKSVDKFSKSRGARAVKKQKEDALKTLVKSGKGVTVVGKKSKEVAEWQEKRKTTKAHAR